MNFTNTNNDFSGFNVENEINLSGEIENIRVAENCN